MKVVFHDQKKPRRALKIKQQLLNWLLVYS
jgi:hypothetical protein